MLNYKLKLLALLLIIRLEWKFMVVANTLAYCSVEFITVAKSVIVLALRNKGKILLKGRQSNLVSLDEI